MLCLLLCLIFGTLSHIAFRTIVLSYIFIFKMTAGEKVIMCICVY